MLYLRHVKVNPQKDEHVPAPVKQISKKQQFTMFLLSISILTPKKKNGEKYLLKSVVIWKFVSKKLNFYQKGVIWLQEKVLKNIWVKIVKPQINPNPPRPEKMPTRHSLTKITKKETKNYTRVWSFTATKKIYEII